MGQNKLVVYGHKRMLDLFAAKAGQPAETDQYGQKQLDRNTAELPRKRNITAQCENGGQQPEASEQHGAGQGGKDCHYQRKVDRNPAKTVIGHYVEKDQNGGGDDPEKRDKRYYDPLFGTGGRLAEDQGRLLLGAVRSVFPRESFQKRASRYRPAASEFTRPHAPQALHLKLPDAQGLTAASGNYEAAFRHAGHLARSSGRRPGK